MAKKRIGDCTFEEFCSWGNARACDGRWSMNDALNTIVVIREVNEVKPLFGKKKAREKKWKELRAEHLNLDAEIEV